MRKNFLKLIFSIPVLGIFLIFFGCQKINPGACYYHKQNGNPGNSNPNFTPAYNGGPSTNEQWGDHVQKVWWNISCINYYDIGFDTESAKLNCMRNDNKDRLYQQATANVDDGTNGTTSGTTYRWRDTDYPSEREYSYDTCEKIVTSSYVKFGTCTYKDMELIFYKDTLSNSTAMQKQCEDRGGTWKLN